MSQDRDQTAQEQDLDHNVQDQQLYQDCTTFGLETKTVISQDQDTVIYI